MSLSREDPVVLSRHAALKTRDEGDVLVLPERAIRLRGSGGEILRLCLEARSPDEILATLSRRYPDSPELEDSVMDFLEEMIGLGGVVQATTGGGVGR